VADLQDELVLHHDILRIAAERVARRIIGFAIIGADEAALAILLQPFVAGGAALAAVDHAADADRVADLEGADMIANRGHMADDFVAGNAGIEGAVPFGTDLVQVRMADAAIGDIDCDIMRTDGAAFDVEGFERLVGGVGAIGFGGHGDVPLLEVRGVQGICPSAAILGWARAVGRPVPVPCRKSTGC